MTSKVRKGVYEVLRGSLLTDESAFKNWRMIIFIVFLLLIMISSAHSYERKVIQISNLNEVKRGLRAMSIDVETTKERMLLESSVLKRAKEMGLMSPKTPPKKIRIITNK